jgi:UDP-N-acetylmuramoyl-L-alanyl-D-glutamate--2,6-diaminopimelate ligase
MNLFNVPMASILTIVKNLPVVSGRMQKIKVKNKPLVVIDFAHTPDALEKVLSTLKNIQHDKVWCIFGCGGGRDKTKYPIMGAIAEKFADYVILTDDNPRDDDPEAIVHGILKGMKKNSPILVEHDRRKALEYAISHAGMNDIILVAGKGHENYQLIGKEVKHYSDVETVEEILND